MHLTITGQSYKTKTNKRLTKIAACEINDEVEIEIIWKEQEIIWREILQRKDGDEIAFFLKSPKFLCE